MRTFKITSRSTAQTTRLGESLSKHFHKGDIVCLFGDLGSGKTTLIKGLAKGLRVRASQVNSPTFVLMNRYEGKLPLYHFDLYRLDDIKQIGGLGYEEFLYGDGVAVIEWAEKLKDLMPESYLGIYLSHVDDHERLIEIKPCGEKYQNFLQSRKVQRK